MAQVINLLTLSDGFGDSRAVPAWYPDYIKWPEIIQLITQGVTVHNFSRYGAGNEYIIQCLRNNLDNKQAVIIQWAMPNRLDLVLAHNKENQKFWSDQIANDETYRNNVLLVGDDHIWLSSASKNSAIQEYHKKFISARQHQMRSQLYVEHAKLLLKDIPHGFMLTKNSEYLSCGVADINEWFWHEPWQGMCEFRQYSKYADLDLGITQPLPLIQFDFIKKFIQPKFDLPWRSERDIQAVENMLYRKYQESLKNKPL